jgi:hypothetical protein
MNYLKINDNKAYFLKVEDSGNTLHPIDEITKEDLFRLLNHAIDSEFLMDDYDETKLQNTAHQIIYKHLHDKFKEITLNKSKFKDDCENLYKDALEKYKQDGVSSPQTDKNIG